MADGLAQEASFFSIGSNDLTCQILGLDRRDPTATRAMAAHPAVLDAIARVVAHPLVTPLLIGLGCDSLSVGPAALDEVRARIRRLRHDTCASLAAVALTRETPEEVWRPVEQCGRPSLPCEEGAGSMKKLVNSPDVRPLHRPRGRTPVHGGFALLEPYEGSDASTVQPT